MSCNSISVTLSVQKTIGSSANPPYTASYNVTIKDESTLFGAMRAAYSSGFTYEIHEKAGFGTQITTIDGLTAQGNQYWAVFHAGANNAVAQKISNIQMQNGDHFVFVLEING